MMRAHRSADDLLSNLPPRHPPSPEMVPRTTRDRTSPKRQVIAFAHGRHDVNVVAPQIALTWTYMTKTRQFVTRSRAGRCRRLPRGSTPVHHCKCTLTLLRKVSK
ncbi:Uncharacterised protein [Amycolatopsis camponoti]|uniref:Uncharacterized protein n=1 Tax=Amycolatopsis camponoti TaxID=2606593 RepID=A0A6I8M4U9_9PSEU|nr:Uncharacterised protein [Amycolatopsis camponoti]